MSRSDEMDGNGRVFGTGLRGHGKNMQENIGDWKLRFLSFLKSYLKCQWEDFRNIHGQVENQKKMSSQYENHVHAAANPEGASCENFPTASLFHVTSHTVDRGLKVIL